MTSINLSVHAFDFLIDQRQFPSAALGIGQEGDEHFQPTITVIDPTTERPLAIIEMREDANELTLNSSASECSQFLERAQLSVPVYLLTPSNTRDPDVRIFLLTGKHKWGSINKNNFPTYQELLSSRSKKDRITLKTDQSLAELKRIAHALSAFLLCILGFSITSLITLSQESLFILLGAIVCAVLPYYTSIKAFGIEAQRELDEQKSDQKPTNTF